MDVALPLPPPSYVPTAILELDKNTPDAHVPRDARMIRLTGAPPFNAEAPLPTLLREGFLTSPELFFVRNHGPVPLIPEEKILDWELTVDG
jgi:nitrate reductase (NAD(P)H)